MDMELFQAYMTEMILMSLDLLEAEVETNDCSQARAMLEQIGITI